MLGYLKSKKVLAIIIIFVVVIVLVPLAFIFITHPPKLSVKNVMPKTETVVFAPTDKLADFNDTPIYVSDLNPLALEQYQVSDAKTLGPASLYNLLSTYVERKILDKQKLGDISTQIAQVEKTMGLTGNQAKYEALREKFAASTVKGWTVFTIDFWLSPTSADGSILENGSPINEKYASLTNAGRKQIITDVNNALNYAKTKMQSGISVFKVATQIRKDYPSIADILAINGGIFGNSTNPASWVNPAAYYYNNANASIPFYKTMYAMTENSPVTKVLNVDNMGGHVIKIVKITNPNGMLDNYQDWLKNQESNLKISNQAILNAK